MPMRLPVEQRQELFAAVVGAVEGWEPAPAERDEWDADVAGCPADEWPEIVALASSRQAWAEEALKVDPPLATEDEVGDIVSEFGGLNTFLTDQVTEKLFEFYAIYPKPPYRTEPLSRYVCACVPDAQASTLVEAGFTRPQCTVHPEGGGAS